jgi:hypothetical protein
MMSDRDYRALEAVNYSSLKHMRKSPKHYKHMLENPDTSTNYAMLRAIHALVLEPFTFEDSFTVWTGGRRDKRNAEYAAFIEASGARDILTPDEVMKAGRISEAYRGNVYLEQLLAHPGTHCELAMVWKDLETGLACKGKPDIVCVEELGDGLIRLTVADLKTFYTSDKRSILRQGKSYGWPLQLAHYTRGAIEHFGLRGAWELGMVDVEWATIVAEEEAPHDCSAVKWGLSSQRAADRQLSVLLQTLKQCLETGVWPGRGDQSEEDGLGPDWEE